MKKRLLYLLLLAATGLSACQSGTTETNANANDTASAVEIKTLNDDEFEKLVGLPKNQSEWNFASDKPVMVDFYASWCGPCKKMSPNVEKIAANYPAITVYKVDVDKAKKTAVQFGIQQIPTIIFFDPKSGKLSALDGLRSYETLESNMKEAFGMN